MRKSRFLVLLTVLCALSFPALACKEYKDAMDDLESKLPPVSTPSETVKVPE